MIVLVLLLLLALPLFFLLLHRIAQIEAHKPPTPTGRFKEVSKEEMSKILKKLMIEK